MDKKLLNKIKKQVVLFYTNNLGRLNKFPADKFNEYSFVEEVLKKYAVDKGMPIHQVLLLHDIETNKKLTKEL